jgi:hypothetical protein
MIRMSSGMSSVSVVVDENNDRSTGGIAFFMLVATSSLTVLAW